MDDPRDIGSAEPFKFAANMYREKHWDVVPLPPREKRSPPTGFTGRINKNRFALDSEIAEWFAATKWVDLGTDPKTGRKLRRPPWAKGNIAVHPGRKIVINGVEYEAIGIDVDDYGDKHGYSHLRELEEDLGTLPDTWISSARTDCRSGVRWFLTHYGWEYKGKVAESIETIQHIHRYGVVWPSWHPETRQQYYWYEPGRLPNGRDVAIEIPSVTDLSLLPEAWYKYLLKGFRSVDNQPIDLASMSTELIEWAKEHFGKSDKMCRRVMYALRKKTDEIENSPDHHDPLVAGHMNLLLLATEGHTGCLLALRSMEQAWMQRIESEGDASDRTPWLAKAELARSREGALRKTKGAIDDGSRALVVVDPCAISSQIPIEEKYTKGQVRMAHRMVQRYKGNLIFVPNVGWYVWDGIRWQEDTENRVSQYVLRTVHKALRVAKAKYEEAAALPAGPAQDALNEQAKKLSADAAVCQSSSGIDGVLKIARTYPQFARPAKDLDTEPYLINVQNCTVDLLTGECREHNPLDLITKVCNVVFDPNEFANFNPKTHCPKWFKFLEEVLPDAEVRDFMGQLMGLSLVGTQLEHVLVILYGNGRNGKGVFEEVMRHVWGDYSVSAASDLFSAQPGSHTTSQTDLMGKRLVIIDETESNANVSEALVKKMTGGGQHTARRMRQDNIRFQMTWLAVMVTNYLPPIAGTSAAIWDRLVVVEFPRYFNSEERDKFLRDTLKEENNGIFMWAYKSWLAYQRNGSNLVLPQLILDAGKEYRHSHDKIQMWIDQCCQIGVGDLFKSKPVDLIKDYHDWSLNEPGAQQLGKKQFLEALRRKDFRYDKATAKIVGLRVNPNRVQSRAKGAAE